MTFPIRSQRIVLALLTSALALAFWVTHLIVVRYKAERGLLAVEWRDRGMRDLPKHPAQAVVDYETALSYADESDVRFSLAQALVESGRFAEAQAQLLTLWTEAPGDGRINLQLARLAASANDEGDAVRYYHAAIDGAWESGVAVARRTARLELAKFLLSKGQAVRAQAELIAMIDDLPADAELITDVGRLLIDAGADARAMTLLQRALMVAPSYPRAARLAGGVAFRSGDYRLAQRYLSEAAALEPLASDSRDQLDVASRLLALDPSAAHLNTRTRVARTLACIAVARRRIDACHATAESADMTTRLDELAKVRERELVRDPDLIDTAMSTVFHIEVSTTACGQPSPDDRALQLLGGQRRGATR